ncbi:Gfo/Idh/MocA family oxidoreductase [Paenibacillus sp. MWE-103]|uniref:Gfo/Idh/MocA family oxidoreductase n=1 Tax=Paenibacillus artemisiicola TaxID=1172618 RepID=A0ABS3WDQ6_9BACL|nr:Gfo/Idh/MocA family oxidoreductase [Paenibacillus artemisiicola]MBO7746454.1 Gfo/Idh/MocA family oxidoreductase [Paenibacillus artemisiicola]
MRDRLKVGIVGCGSIANGKHLPSLSKLPHVELCAFSDIAAERAEQAAEKFGAPGARVYADYRELLLDGSIDVVHVCTPNDAHAEVSIAALEAGKHVMCEKPMAKTAADARRMAEAARRTGKKLTIGYNNRFRPDSQYMKQACANGDLGEIYFAKAHALRRRGVPTWGVFLDREKQGGGPLIDIGTHALDLTLWLMDNYEPRAVLGTSYRKLAPRKDAANADGSWDPETFTVEDAAFGMVVMKNGATVMLESSWAINMVDTLEARYTLCGTEGGADVKDRLRLNGEKYGRLYENEVKFDVKGADFFTGRKESMHDREIRLWIEAVLNDTQPVVTPEQACVVSEIIEAVYESNRTGRAVYFD